MPRSLKARTYIEDEVHSIATKIHEVENIRATHKPKKAFIDISSSEDDSSIEGVLDSERTEESSVQQRTGFLDTTNELESSQPVDSSSDDSTTARKAKRGRRTTTAKAAPPPKSLRLKAPLSQTSTASESSTRSGLRRRSPRIAANSKSTSRPMRNQTMQIKEPVSPQLPLQIALSSDESEKENLCISFDQLSTPSAREKRASNRTQPQAVILESDSDDLIIMENSQDAVVEKELERARKRAQDQAKRNSNQVLTPQKEAMVTVKVLYLHNALERFDIPAKAPRGYRKVLHTVLEYHGKYVEDYSNYKLLGVPSDTDVCDLSCLDSLEQMEAAGVLEPIFVTFRVVEVALERQLSEEAPVQEVEEESDDKLTLRIECASARNSTEVTLPRETTFTQLKEVLIRQNEYFLAFKKPVSRKVGDKEFQVGHQTNAERRQELKRLQVEEHRAAARGQGLGIQVDIGATNRTTAKDIVRNERYKLYFVDPDGDEIKNESMEIGNDDLDLENDDQIEVKERILKK